MLLKRLTLPIREEFVSATFVPVWHAEKWEAEGALCTDQRIKCAVEQFVQSKPTEARGCRGDAVAASNDHHCVHYNGGHSQSTPFRLITEFAED